MLEDSVLPNRASDSEHIESLAFQLLLENMPSSLVYKANQINEIVNGAQITQFPIRWSNYETKCIHGTKHDMKRYLVLSLVWKSLLFRPILLFGLYLMIFKNHGIFQVHQIFYTAQLLQVLYGIIFPDYIFVC